MRAPGFLIVAAGFSALFLADEQLPAAIPYDSARVSYVENNVSIGALGGAARRKAGLRDTVRSSEYVQTGVESRAELQFEDTSLVRVGQNSVFTFEAANRSLHLKEGAMLFYVPPGSPATEVRTPSITAAITGTMGKTGVENSREFIAVLSGSLNTRWGKVQPGWAIEWANGRVRIFRFDPDEVTRGKLYSLGGRRLPEEPEVLKTEKMIHLGLGLPDFHQHDVHDWNQTNANVRRHKSQPPPVARKEEEEEDSTFHHPFKPQPTPNPYL